MQMPQCKTVRGKASAVQSDRSNQTNRVSGKPKIRVENAYLQRIYQRLSLLTVLIPVLGTVVAIASLRYFPIGIIEIVLSIVMYAITIFGIEVGFHRYFSHHAFQTSTPVKAILAMLGSMAAMGGVVFWVAHHRRHHQYSDLTGDPHSPALHGDSIGNKFQGLWHAHLGWTLTGEISNSTLFAKDLLQDPIIAQINRWQQVWVIIGLAVPAIADGLLTGTWLGVFQGFIWGGLVRIFLGHQLYWTTNSLCHVYGDRPFAVDDDSSNNFWLAIPSWGQSWHNNHHAFPNSATMALEKWQLDPGIWMLRVLELMGLVWQIKVPTAKQIKAKKSAS